MQSWTSWPGGLVALLPRRRAARGPIMHRAAPRGLRRFLLFMRTAMEVSDALARIAESASRAPRAPGGLGGGSSAVPTAAQTKIRECPHSDFSVHDGASRTSIEASQRRGRSS